MWPGGKNAVSSSVSSRVRAASRQTARSSSGPTPSRLNSMWSCEPQTHGEADADSPAPARSSASASATRSAQWASQGCAPPSASRSRRVRARRASPPRWAA